MKKKYIYRSICFVSVVSTVLVLSGCTTTPEVGSFRDPYAGYLYCCANHNNTYRQSYGRIIADEKLKNIQRYKPSENTRAIRDWESYRRQLEKPVVITAADYQSSSELRDAKLFGDVEAYLLRDPSALEFSGEAYSSQWRDEMNNTDKIIASLNRDKNECIKKAKTLLAKLNYTDAISMLERALEYDPGDIQVKREIATQMQAANVYLNEQVKMVLLQANKESTAEAIKLLEGMYTQLQRFQGGEGNVLKEARMNLIAEIGDKWVDAISKYAYQQNYWNSYLLTKINMEKLEGEMASDSDVLKVTLQKKYQQILPDAMQYYMDEAARRYSEELYGLSYIYCGMVAELYDYANEINVPASGTVADWNERCMQLMTSISKAVEKLVERRLIIYDFATMKRDVYDNYSYMLRSQCYTIYQKNMNKYAWGMQVPEAQSLTAGSLRPEPGANDIVITGTLHDNTISPVEQTEIARRPYMVGGSIAEEPNPFYKIKTHPTHTLRTVFVQEVNRYDEVKLEHAKEVNVNLTVRYFIGNEPDRQHDLFSIRETFDELEDLTLKSTEIKYMGPINAKPRMAPVRERLKADPLPQSVAASLSSNGDIDRKVAEIVLRDLILKINQLVVSYPVEELLDPGLADMKKEQYATAADKIGCCMLYCRKLSEPQFEVVKYRRGNGWIVQNDVTMNNIRSWTKSRWSSYPEATQNYLDNLWSQSVSLTQKCK